MSGEIIKAPIEPEILGTETHWEVDPEKTQDHWLQLRDPQGDWGCYVKWDGCTVIWEIVIDTETGERKEGEGMHICELEEFIERLQEAVASAKEHFGEGNWPG